MNSEHGADWAAVRDELQFVLSRPLERLITAEDQVLIANARGWDIPEVLRPHHPGLHKPAVSFFNSSVAQYVETAWRWHGALGVIRKVDEPAPTAPEEAVVGHYDGLYGCVEFVVDAVRRLDSSVAADSPESVWIELIRENSI